MDRSSPTPRELVEIGRSVDSFTPMAGPDAPPWPPSELVNRLADALETALDQIEGAKD